MRILILGANGFIARAVLLKLKAAGHDILAASRRPSPILENISGITRCQIDLLSLHHEKDWQPHLENIDVVINCIGVFQTPKRATINAIHYEAPKILFNACQTYLVKNVIQISALGIDHVSSAYSDSKLAIEKHLNSLAIDSTIIRPSFVYGKDCYGGSAFFRGLVGLPGIIPLPGKAEQLMQPIHIDDLAMIIEESITLPGKNLLCAVGPEKLSVKALLNKLRAWLGFKKAWNISIPLIFLVIGSKVGDFFYNSPLSSTGIKMMKVDNVATAQEQSELTKKIKHQPRSFSEGLENMSSGVQDRWHARLYFLRPALRLSLAGLWIITGLITLMITKNNELPTHFLYAVSLIDILLGLAILVKRHFYLAGSLQCLFILAYILLAIVITPTMWLYSFSSMLKNIPLLFATLIMLSLESER